MGKISVFLADWQVLFREGIHFTLSGEEDFEVIGEATTNEEALTFIEANLPQVAVLNINRDKLSGIEATRRIKQNLPSVAVILVMEDENLEQTYQALKSAANGHLKKDADPEDLINLIRKVSGGSYPIAGVLLKPAIAGKALEEFTATATIGEPLSKLLARLAVRESDVLRHVVEGKTKPQIAQVMGLTETAIDQQLEMVRAKLVSNEHTRNVIEAAQAYLAIIPGKVSQPGMDYVTREEFQDFKESLKERFKSTREKQARG